METLTQNISLKVTRRKLGGRDYLVAPVSLIVPGVLNGSQGPLYYPPDEIALNLSAWNSMPIVVYHPRSNGQAVSAKSPTIISDRGIGFLFDARVENGKLKADGWFSVQDTERVDNRILQALQGAKAIEVSTGLVTHNEPAPTGASHNGIPYNFIARNYKPDHLAILPDQVGACSNTDGCGVLINQDKQNEGGGSPSNNSSSSDKGESNMTPKQKAELIGSLVENGCCGDKETLEGFSDEALVLVKTQADATAKQELVINAATQEYTDSEGTVHTWNTKKGTWEAKPKTPKTPKKKPGDETVENKNKVEEPKQLTDEEWVKTAPASVQNRLAFAADLETDAKKAIVEKLITNLEGEDRVARGNTLMEKSLGDLKDLEFLAPEPPPTRVSNYFGSSAPAAETTENAQANFAPFGQPQDYLPTPSDGK